MVTIGTVAFDVIFMVLKLWLIISSYSSISVCNQNTWYYVTAVLIHSTLDGRININKKFTKYLAWLLMFIIIWHYNQLDCECIALNYKPMYTCLQFIALGCYAALAVVLIYTSYRLYTEYKYRMVFHEINKLIVENLR